MGDVTDADAASARVPPGSVWLDTSTGLEVRVCEPIVWLHGPGIVTTRPVQQGVRHRAYIAQSTTLAAFLATHDRVK